MSWYVAFCAARTSALTPGRGTRRSPAVGDGRDIHDTNGPTLRAAAPVLTLVVSPAAALPTPPVAPQDRGAGRAAVAGGAEGST